MPWKWWLLVVILIRGVIVSIKIKFLIKIWWISLSKMKRIFQHKSQIQNHQLNQKTNQTWWMIKWILPQLPNHKIPFKKGSRCMINLMILIWMIYKMLRIRKKIQGKKRKLNICQLFQEEVYYSLLYNVNLLEIQWQVKVHLIMRWMNF